MINNTLYRPKLESGLKTTLWSPMSVYTSSLIKQTADGILLEVEKIVGDGEYATKADLEITASGITQTVRELSNTVSGNSENIGKLQVTAREIRGEVDEFIYDYTQQNLFSSNGWMDKNESFVLPDDNMCYSAETSYIISQKTYLEAGTYCVSLNSANKHFVITKGETTITPTITSSTTESYQSLNRYYDVFTVETAGDYKFKVGANDADTLFYRPKLEEGDHPTDYIVGSVHYGSLIRQTSKEIELKVIEETNENGVINRFKETGIDITSGRILLNADNTDINGNLRLYATNDADALTLHDSNGIARTTVTSQEIGGLSSQSMDASKTYSKSGIMTKGQSTVWDFDSKYYPANSIAKCGSTGYGRVAYYVGYYYDASLGRNNGRVITSPNSCKVELQLVCVDDNGETVLTFPQQQTTQNYSTYYLESRVIEGNDSVTITKAGNYKPRIKVTWADGSTTSPFNDATHYSIQCYMSSESPSKTLMGADGMYMTNGAEKYMYYGNDGFAASYTQQMLNGIAYGRSSVGARNSGFNTTSGEPDNKYLYTGGITGPSHIAKFKNGGEQWTNSQTYVNTATHIKNSYYNSNYYTPYPSTDLIFVMDGGDDGKQMINLGDLEYDGHVVMIKSQHSPVHLYLGSNNYVLFVGPRGGKYRNYEINAYYVKLVYLSGSGSGPDAWDNYNGMWLILDEQED